MYGTVEFYKSCLAAKVKPILGIETYTTTDKDGLAKEDHIRDNYHMILLAINNTGLKNLYWLISNANQNNFYYKPRISLRNFETHNEGIIATSACIGGPLCKFGGVMDLEHKSFTDPEGKAEAMMKWLSDVFKNRFFLEVQDHEGLIEQALYNEWLINLGKKLDLPFIVTTDAHYMKKEDFEVHQMIMAQQLKKTLASYIDNAEMNYGKDYFIRPEKDMIEIANKWNILEAISNTEEIAERCNCSIELGVYKMPQFPIEDAADYPDYLKWKKEK